MAWNKPKSEEAMINYQVRQICTQERDKALTAIAKVGTKMTEKQGKNIIKLWFGKYDGIDMVAAFKCEAEKITDSTMVGHVNFNSYIDLNIYGARPTAESYMKRNHLSGEDSATYVANLQLYKGIIGLPAKGQRKLPEGTPVWGKGRIEDNHWINENFIERTPLITVLKNAVGDETFLQSIVKASRIKMK